MRVGAALQQARVHLDRLDAEVLLGHVLGKPRSWLHAHPEAPLDTEDAARFADLLIRRRGGEPVAYLIGEKEFWSLNLKISPAVLVPRPETEVLVEQALARIPDDAGWRIADLGTGSGAIALAIASERPGCRLLATDASEAALEVAAANRARLGLLTVEFARGDWCGALGVARFAMIVSNPPYVARGDPQLDANVAAFEPAAALDGGGDGLDHLRQIIQCAPRHLEPGGWLLLEHAPGQEPALAAALRTAGFSDIRLITDLANRPRLTVARR
ncbi:MAG: peptide chain release factor N(5)-glutamine methyltransferase [Gammaproteobacteria bacterium]|nr:peptide chain release factor N(5)-glutamine methyltransferase [Gammaproteobacteria bacterium]